MNFRKSIKLFGGLRLNLSKSGVGVSAGVPGVRVGIGPKGARVTTGIPGTGIYQTKKIKIPGKQAGKPQQDNPEIVYLSKPPHYAPYYVIAVILFFTSFMTLLPGIFILKLDLIIGGLFCGGIGYLNLWYGNRNKKLRELFFEEVKKLQSQEQ